MNVSQAEYKMRYMVKENKELKEYNDRLLKELENMQRERNLYRENYELVAGSSCWKMTYPLRFVSDGIRKLSGRMFHVLDAYAALAAKIPYSIKNRGLQNTIRRIFTSGRASLSAAQSSVHAAVLAENDDVWNELAVHLDQTPHDFIDIFGVPMGWNTPLFQRFQHLSMQAGKAGGISFYGAHPSVDKDVELYRFLNPHLCLVNLENNQVKSRFFEVMDQRSELKYIRFQSIDLATTVKDIQSYMSRGYEIVYEYIDELTPQITGEIPAFVFERHKFLLENEDVTAIATSDKLFAQMKPYRSRNMAIISNGVDYEHWNVKKEALECPQQLLPAVRSGQIIVGYHGALAGWVDYELLKEIADDERFFLVLIGYEHDQAMRDSGLLQQADVLFLGPKPYSELPEYAAFYDVAVLPFLINDLTLSVSPVKIFEYMALEKPVVAYALPECRKYESCLCAQTREEFMSRLGEAVLYREDENYKKILRREALDNTWLAAAVKTVSIVKQHQEQKRRKKLEKGTVLNKQKEDLWNTALSAAVCQEYLNEIVRIPSQHKDKAYVSLAEDSYRRKKGDTKIIAYYLTQFHPDPHNEKWWGKGVTEWDHVSRAVPQFPGHYQPRFPGELGYYDLRILDHMKRQVQLARQYGIWGFSFYYYWFDGERLLEAPLEMYLAHKEIDFPFSLCWANENWTKRFDGTDSGVLMKQPTTEESYRQVITDMVRFLKDRRYITFGGKKIITVYRPSLMPQVKEVLKFWRNFCRQQGIGEIYLIAVKENMVTRDWLKEGYDAVTEFHPGTLYAHCTNITNTVKAVRRDFAAEVFSYESIVREKQYFNYNESKLFRAVMPMWDNTARRNHKGMIFHGSSPKLYKEWLLDVIRESRERTDLEESAVFINAWNEWGEGAYLEPDKRYGYAYLAATREAVESVRSKETFEGNAKIESVRDKG